MISLRSACFAVLCSAMVALSARDFSVSREIIETYDRMLQKNPDDYETLFSRAMEYVNLEDYIKAIADLDKALSIVPQADSEMRLALLTSRGDILFRTHRYAETVNDMDNALEIDNDCMSCIALRAAANYRLAQFDMARNDYLSMRRRNMRSTEAIFGLSKTAAASNDSDEAIKLANEALDLTSNSSEAYANRAEVYRLLGREDEAVNDLLRAMNAGGNGSRNALRLLLDLSETNYRGVYSGLTRAISENPKIGIYYYIRGVVAQQHFHYVDALADYNTISNGNFYAPDALAPLIAESHFALGEYSKALRALDNVSDSPTLLTLKSRIFLALDEVDEAASSAQKALSLEPENAEAQVQLALVMSQTGDYDKAIALLSEATMTNPDRTQWAMQRAWLLDDKLGEHDAALRIYEIIADNDADPADVKSLRGFAMLFAGLDEQAHAWMNALLNNETDSDGLINYYAACFYAQSGNNAKALECMEQSLKKGYSDYYNWKLADDSRVSVAPLRTLPEFNNLMEKYHLVFDR